MAPTVDLTSPLVWLGAIVILATIDSCAGDSAGVRNPTVVLSFLTEPTSAEGQVPFTPVRVSIRDSGSGRPVSDIPVSLQIAFSNTGEPLRGTTTVTAVSGIATFDNVWLALPGNGFYLDARSGSATSVTSTPFNVKLTFLDATAGDFHTCGVTVANYAYCWGLNTFGSLGDNTTVSKPSPSPVAGRLHFTQATAGALETCAVGPGGVARCWGYTFRGPGGTDITQSAPAPLDGNPALVQVSTAHFVQGAHTCGIAQDSVAFCWGANENGRLGDGTDSSRSAPTRVYGTMKFVLVSVGGGHACGITVDSLASCWGQNFAGQLGDGSLQDRWTPTLVSGGIRFLQVSAGGTHSCGMTGGGDAYCWGDNSTGQLGDGTQNPQLVPVPVVGGLSFVQLSATGTYTCGLAVDHHGYCWGYNYYGNLGDSTNVSRLVPTPIAGNLSFATLSAGLSHTCGVTTDHLLYCWGDNVGGQLGDSTFRSQLAPHRARQ